MTVSKDGQLVTINSNDRVSSEVRLVRCGAPMDPPTLVHPRQEGVQYFVEHNNVRESTASEGTADGLIVHQGTTGRAVDGLFGYSVVVGALSCWPCEKRVGRGLVGCRL